MPREWETVTEENVDASPEQVWQAIATGPGQDAWFVGSNDVQPGVGGTLRSTMGDYVEELAVTAWEPPHRFAYRSAVAADGRFFALEWLVDGRAGGTTLRCVASGFLPGDDWEAEFESLQAGGAMYFYSLVQYLSYFRGRRPRIIDALGPPMADIEHAWRLLTAGLGLNGEAPKAGDQVRLTPVGLAPIDGVVYAAAPNVLSVRSHDGLYRFVMAPGPSAMVGHRIFASDVDQPATERAWQGWLNQVFDTVQEIRS